MRTLKNERASAVRPAVRLTATHFRRVSVLGVVVVAAWVISSTLTTPTALAAPTGCTAQLQPPDQSGISRGAYSFCQSGAGFHRVEMYCEFLRPDSSKHGNLEQRQVFTPGQ